MIYVVWFVSYLFLCLIAAATTRRINNSPVYLYSILLIYIDLYLVGLFDFFAIMMNKALLLIKEGQEFDGGAAILCLCAPC